MVENFMLDLSVYKFPESKSSPRGKQAVNSFNVLLYYLVIIWEFYKHIFLPSREDLNLFKKCMSYKLNK
jgi:bacteriorhodopsin